MSVNPDAPPTASRAIIRRLAISNFRGIEQLEWNPEPGVNVILGGGDVGKTTILDAIALLLSPTNATTLSDADYWRRDLSKGFAIEATISLPDRSGINQQTKPSWPWEWDGNQARLPSIDEETATQPDADIVYRLVVRGTPDLELVYEVLQPNGEADHLSVGVRRAIGLVRLSGDDRNDRDLRLVQGSALDRLLSDPGLRSRMGHRLSEAEVEDQLLDPAKEKLKKLDETFISQALPASLGLGLTGGQGMSVNALIGLTAAKADVTLPLAAWGAGTRRLASLQIASFDQSEQPITLVDEIERGLEPYRQRNLISKLFEANSQVFLTTHSSFVVSAAHAAAHWYLDAKGTFGKLDRVKTRRFRIKDPEMFLSRLTIVAEGLSEYGFVISLLEATISFQLFKYGIRVTNGEGNTSTLGLLDAVTVAGLTFGGFADNEGEYEGRWRKVEEKLGKLLFRWPSGCLEENVVRLVPDDRLIDLITDPRDEETGERLRTLAVRLGIDSKEFRDITAAAPNLKSLIIEAATGALPTQLQNADASKKKEFKKHAERWFKSQTGGGELLQKVFNLGIWPHLEPQLLPFVNAVRQAVSLPELSKFPQ